MINVQIKREKKSEVTIKFPASTLTADFGVNWLDTGFTYYSNSYIISHHILSNNDTEVISR